MNGVTHSIARTVPFGTQRHGETCKKVSTAVKWNNDDDDDDDGTVRSSMWTELNNFPF